MIDLADFKKLAPETQELLTKASTLLRLKSKEDLKKWVLFYLDVDLSDCIVSRYADSSPLDMVWDIYDFCANEQDGPPKSFYFIASRSSQKTLSCAVLQILLPLHFARGVVHLGGTEDQAHRAYAYFTKFAGRKYIKPFIVGDPKISGTTLNVNDKQVMVEILPITIASVQGPHQPVVSIDELASLAPQKMAAYPDIAGIPSYTEDGKPWVKFGISTRKGAYTIIETEYEQRIKKRLIFKFWTIFENTQQCPESRHGIEPYGYYVNISENQVATQEQYAFISPEQRSKFELVSAFKGCLSCPLSAVCFIPGTPVRMYDGSLKNIEEIKEGDKVLTHTGEIRSVIKTMKNEYNGEVYAVDAFGQKDIIYCTPNHPWLTEKGWKNASALSLNEPRNPDYDKKIYDNADFLIKPRPKLNFLGKKEYERYNNIVSDCQIKILGDRVVGLERSRKDKGYVRSSVPLDIPLNYEWGYICGLYLSEGSFARGTRKGKNNKNPNAVHFSFHKDETHLIEFLRNFSKKYLNKKEITVKFSSRGKGVQVTVCCRVFAELMNRWFGSGCDKKRIPAHMIQSYSKRFLNGLWKGTYEGDGCKTKKNEKNLTLANPHLIQQIHFVLLSEGCNATLNPIRIHKNKRTTQSIYWSESTTKKQRLILNKENKMLCRLRANPEKRAYSGFVYNLEVEEDHSYVVGSLAVHNCGGDASKQKSTCRTLKPIVATIEEFTQSEYNWFLSQKMSLTPSLEGMIFPKFKREKFEKTPNEIYEMFFGEKPQKDISELELIDKMHERGIKAWAGLDHGYTDPMVIVIVFQDGVDNVYVMKVFAQTQLDPNEVVNKVAELQFKYRFTHLYPDTAQPAINKLIKDRKCVKVIDDFSKKDEIARGITLIREKLAPSTGGTKLFGLKGNCDFLMTEMEKYHYIFDAAEKPTDEPADEWNHSIDGLRYLAINRWVSKNKIFAVTEPTLVKHETQAEYQKKIDQQHQGWLKSEIQSAVAGQGGDEAAISQQGIKGKGILWDV